MDDYMTMREIGALVGISSHAVGRKLKELGYRTSSKKPSAEAFRAGVV